jgi:group I intron endonuclease
MNIDKIGSVYKIKCSINNKVYIGVTIQSPPEKRWTSHLRYDKKHYRDKLLFRAFEKHGKGAFSFEVICQTKDIDYLKELEKIFIKEHNSYCNWKTGGYNMTLGGEGVWGLKHTPESKKIMSIKAKERCERIGPPNGMAGKKHTKERKKQISKAMSEKYKVKGSHPSTGTNKTQEHKDKISKSLTGHKRGKKELEMRANKISLQWEITFPNGSKEKIKNLRKFCRDNNLKAENLWKTSKGIISHSSGYSCKKI